MSKPFVLIVEDNPINALVLTKSIEKYCQVVHAINDTQTLKAITEYPFEVIFMDINLGGNSLDGEALMKIIREDIQYQHLRIFAVTSYALPEDRERFLNAGFDGYFSKPINKNAIVSTLTETLAARQDATRNLPSA